MPLHFDFSYDYYPTAYYRPGIGVDPTTVQPYPAGLANTASACTNAPGEAAGQAVTLAFAGDVHFMDRTARLVSGLYCSAITPSSTPSSRAPLDV